MYTVQSSVRVSELWVYRPTYYGFQIRLSKAYQLEDRD